MAYMMAEKSIEDRFYALDGQRAAKLDRARACSALTLPELLPPIGWTETEQLQPPYSSIPARGVNALASRMMTALLPLNDLPFFKFGSAKGEVPPLEAQQYLEGLAVRLHKKLSGKNIREVIYQALQQLLVLGDTLMVLEDDMTFRTIRLDHYVVRRDFKGDPIEIIYIEHVADDADEEANTSVALSSYSNSKVSKKGYKCIYHRLVWEADEKAWYQSSELDKEIVNEGKWVVPPVVPLRWQAVSGENYGRSHVEANIGDVKALESYTASLIEGLAASSSFWMAVDPAGVTVMDDIASQPNGSWVAARQQDVTALSPSATMNPQVQMAFQAVESMRKEIAQSFLMQGAAIPQGDRVTATAVRVIGQELEQVLGGVFSSIARELLSPIVRRTLFLMVDAGEVDQRLEGEFGDDPVLNIDIVTGLQALSRESERERLMAMGEMVRNLPPEAVQNFRWDSYASALVTSLGFDPRNWIVSPEEQEQKKQAEMAQAQQMQMQQQMMQGAAPAIAEQAQQNPEVLEQVASQVMMQGGPQ